jgi:hypothetical protein
MVLAQFFVDKPDGFPNILMSGWFQGKRRIFSIEHPFKTRQVSLFDVKTIKATGFEDDAQYKKATARYAP